MLTSGDSAAEQRAALLALPGIGPWTAGYVAMRVLGAPDVLLTGDVALRTGAAALGIPAIPRELGQWAEGFAPWRSYLSLHLWRAALAGSAASAGSGASVGSVGSAGSDGSAGSAASVSSVAPRPSSGAAPPPPPPNRLPPVAPPPDRTTSPGSAPPTPGRRNDPHPASPHPRTTRPLTKESS